MELGLSPVQLYRMSTVVRKCNTHAFLLRRTVFLLCIRSRSLEGRYGIVAAIRRDPAVPRMSARVHQNLHLTRNTYKGLVGRAIRGPLFGRPEIGRNYNIKTKL